MTSEARLQRARIALRTAATALSKVAKGPAGLEKAITLMGRRPGTILVTGIGKSGFIAAKIAATLTSLGRPAVFIHPVEALHGDIGITSRSNLLLALSFSGTTSEILRFVRYAREILKLPLVSITGSTTSALARMSDAAIIVPIQEEGSPTGLAPMASTTAMLAVGDALAAALAPEGFKRVHFGRLHPRGSLGLELRSVREVMAKGKSIPAVRDSASLAAAVKKINDGTFGITAVVDAAGKLKGAITDGDVRRYLVRHDSIRGVRASDVMTSRPKSVAPEASLREALELMERHKITALFVLDARQRPAGIVRLQTIVEANLG